MLQNVLRRTGLAAAAVALHFAAAPALGIAADAETLSAAPSLEKHRQFGLKAPGVFREEDPTVRRRLAALFHRGHVQAAIAGCDALEEATENIDRLIAATGLGPLSSGEHEFILARASDLRGRQSSWSREEICGWAITHFGSNGALHENLVRLRLWSVPDPDVTSAVSQVK